MVYAGALLSMHVQIGTASTCFCSFWQRQMEILWFTQISAHWPKRNKTKRGWSMERPSIVAHIFGLPSLWWPCCSVRTWTGMAIHVPNLTALYWFRMQVATGLWRAARSSDKVAKLAIPHCLFCHAALAVVKPHSEAKPLGAPLNSRPHHKSHRGKEKKRYATAHLSKQSWKWHTAI